MVMDKTERIKELTARLNEAAKAYYQLDTELMSNKEYDALYEKVTTLTDEEEKTACYMEMETILTKNAANVYIQDMAEFVALRNTYEGYQFYPLYVLDMSKIRPKNNE